jgi:hypothetical protein
MELMPSMEIDRRSMAGEEFARDSAPNVARLVQLSSWLLVLGTVRVICAFTDSLNAFLDSVRFEPVSLHLLGRFIEENSPVIAVCAAWPLFLAIILRRTSWPQLLPAAGFTFLILSFVGVLELTTQVSHARGDGVTLGSFHLTRRAFLHPTLSDAALGLLGVSQLLAECATGFQCLMLAHRFRAVQAQPGESGKQEGARRARFGRLAVYASAGFLVVMIRLPVWATYVELLNDSSIVREFVLRNDDRRTAGRPRGLQRSTEESRLIGLHIMLETGGRAARMERFLEAKDAYLAIIAQAESVSESSKHEYVSVMAETQNNLGWLLATFPIAELREPRAAVEHARRATEIEPGQGNFWNTLGVACYRAGEWDEARRALRRSMDLRGGGDSFDWFFLALVHLKHGQLDQAREWYDKAVRAYIKNQPNDRELRRFHIEAAQALGLPSPPAPTPIPAIQRRAR